MMIQLLNISFHDLLNPEFYINNGGLWLILFIVFAETGLMFGFFLPGDSLLFVAGIYSKLLIDSIIPGGTGSDFLDVMVLFVMVSISGILGNMVGYWFGKKGGPYLFERKDTFFFKRNTCCRQKNFMTSTEARLLFLPGFCQSYARLRPLLQA